MGTASPESKPISSTWWLRSLTITAVKLCKRWRVMAASFSLQEVLHQVRLFHTLLRSCYDVIHCPICLNTSAKSLLCLYTQGADIYCDGEDKGRDTRLGLVIADERVKGIRFEIAERSGRGDAEHTYPQDRWSHKCRWWFALRLSAPWDAWHSQTVRTIQGRLGLPSISETGHQSSS